MREKFKIEMLRLLQELKVDLRRLTKFTVSHRTDLREIKYFDPYIL